MCLVAPVFGISNFFLCHLADGILLCVFTKILQRPYHDQYKNFLSDIINKLYLRHRLTTLEIIQHRTNKNDLVSLNQEILLQNPIKILRSPLF